MPVLSYMVTHPVSAVSRDLLNLQELPQLALSNPPHTHVPCMIFKVSEESLACASDEAYMKKLER